MSTIHEGQGSLFGVPLAGPGEAVRKPRRHRNKIPVRQCRACGKRFGSWDAERYCTRAECIEARDSGLTLKGELYFPPVDPATCPWPEGF